MYRAQFGQGTGQIFLTNLRCIGNETRLVNCSTVAGRTCSHAEDAGVRCLPRTSNACVFSSVWILFHLFVQTVCKVKFDW